MARRSYRAMTVAYQIVDRLIATEASNRAIARKAGVSEPTVARRRQARFSPNIPNTADPLSGHPPKRQTITWRDLLDALWSAGKSRRVEYRRVLAEYAQSFDDLDAPARVSNRASCGCLAEDIDRSPCPGHNAPRLAEDTATQAVDAVSVLSDTAPFPGRLVAVFSESSPHCALCGRGIKSRGGIEFSNAGQWWSCCRDCRGRVAVARPGRAAA